MRIFQLFLYIHSNLKKFKRLKNMFLMLTVNISLLSITNFTHNLLTSLQKWFLTLMKLQLTFTKKSFMTQLQPQLFKSDQLISKWQVFRETSDLMILTNSFKLKESSLDVEMSFLKLRMLISDVSTAIIENLLLCIDKRLNSLMNARIVRQKAVLPLFTTCQHLETNNM